ncbi:MAG: hypothetical protein Q8N05_21260 [Bacteroidota bacterium]|nr:hypothetical protein [Bacteroidota bacterium]
MKNSVTTCNWQSENINHVFKRTFRTVFGLKIDEPGGENPTGEEVSQFLRELSDMELLISA